MNEIKLDKLSRLLQSIVISSIELAELISQWRRAVQLENCTFCALNIEETTTVCFAVIFSWKSYFQYSCRAAPELCGFFLIFQSRVHKMPRRQVGYSSEKIIISKSLLTNKADNILKKPECVFLFVIQQTVLTYYFGILLPEMARIRRWNVPDSQLIQIGSLSTIRVLTITLLTFLLHFKKYFNSEIRYLSWGMLRGWEGLWMLYSEYLTNNL